MQEVFRVFLERFQKMRALLNQIHGVGQQHSGRQTALRPDTGSERSSGHPVVIGMCANPEPEDAIFDLNSQCPVVKTNPHGPENINLLEVQRRVVGVSLQ